MKLLQMSMIYAVGVVLGITLGHFQAAHWASQTENALLTQIERQQCDEGKPYQGKETRFYDSSGHSKGP